MGALNSRNLSFIKNSINLNSKRIYEFLDLKENWQNIMIPFIYRWSTPFKISFNDRSNLKGVLFISVNRWAKIEILEKQDYIKNRINIYFAENIVEKIVLIPTID